MSNILKIGFDPGYSANKFASVVKGEMQTCLLPSQVGAARQRKKDGLSLGGVIRAKRRAKQPVEVSFNGLRYLAGFNVDAYAEPVERMDFERLKDSPELRATFYAGISQLIPVNGVNPRAALAIALPVEVAQDKKEAAKVEGALKNWLIGEHHFSIDGAARRLSIVAIRARIPQPVASWFDWGMDLSGQWVKGAEAQRAPTLVIDQGFNTLDILAVEGGVISHRVSVGETLGMRRAAERLGHSLRDRYGLTLALYRADQLIRGAANGKKVEVYVGGQLTDVTQQARRALRFLESEVFNFLEQTLDERRREYKILLTGGGVMAMGDALARQFPQGVVLYQPCLANARGLAKLAIRPGFLE